MHSDFFKGAVAWITSAAAPYVSDGRIASKAISELLALLEAPGQEAVVARIVSDLVVSGMEPLTVGLVRGCSPSTRRRRAMSRLDWQDAQPPRNRRVNVAMRLISIKSPTTASIAGNTDHQS